MLPRLFALVAFALILGCAHSLRRDTRIDPALLPPDALQLKEHPNADNSRWFKAFADAVAAQTANNREKACVNYRAAAAEASFPLRDLALLRAHQACPFTEDLSVPWKQRPEAVAWFAEDVLKAREAELEKMTVPEKVQFFWDKAVAEKNERAREMILMDAIGLAEKAADAPLATEARQRLYKNSPRLNPNPTKAEWSAVAADFRRWREFSRSIQLEKKRLDDRRLSADERFALLKSIRQTLKTAQRKPEMLAATADLVNFAKKSFRRSKRDPAAAKRLLDAKVIFARTVWTENRRDLALKALNEARRDLGGLVSLEEVNFVLARLYEEAGDLATAEGFVNASLKERPIVPGLRDKVRWARGWILHKAGRAEDAAAAFTELAGDAKDAGDRARATYWAARDRQDGQARRQGFRDVQKMDPLGFYGLLATRDLGETLPPLKSAGLRAPELTASPELNLQSSVVAEWMIALGIKDGTARVLESVQSELKRNSNAGPDAWLRLASAYARAGEYLPLFAMMTTLPPETRDRLLQDQPELLFPKPWLQETEKAATDAGLLPELLYAIMRQESAFNPRARSAAEAYGLTQLLPENAAGHARRHDIAFHGPEDLFTPETSIRLGAWELRSLFDRWKGSWIPSVASYNANADAVRGWLTVRKRPDTTEFIEEIPYEETRSYIKLVMRNQIFYQRMLANGPTSFPEKCLQLPGMEVPTPSPAVAPEQGPAPTPAATSDQEAPVKR